MQTTVSLKEVLNNLKLANNGYTFASSLSPEFIRRTEQLVIRGAVSKDVVNNIFGRMETIYIVSVL